MKSLLLYLVQVIIASGILYGYYHFLLRNKKFHQYNRFYLLAATGISIIVPFLNIPVNLPAPGAGSSVVFQTLQDISFSQEAGETIIPAGQPRPTVFVFDWSIILYSVYSLVILLFLSRVFLSLRKLRTLVRNHPVEKLEGICFVNTSEPGTPYSFFRWLFWNQKIELRTQKGLQIFRHEFFHIQQKHSLDIIVMELLTSVFWVNPFFHLMKKELKAIHEFLADQFAVNENEKWEYAELLLMQALNTQQSLVNPFFHNQIKRRIAMITNPQKTSQRYLRKLLVLPVAAMILTLFAFNYQQRKTDLFIRTNEPIVIVVDAGHGGIDQGVKSPDGKYTEAQLTLEISKAIQKLAKDFNVTVVMTRDDDNLPGNAQTRNEGLKKRMEINGKANPAAFISIHLNARDAPDRANSGFEAYISAQKNVTSSRNLASFILENVSSIIKVNEAPAQRNETGVYVLDKNNYPSVLLECGYITNEDDLAFLVKPVNQERLARSILSAVVQFHNQTAGKPLDLLTDTIPGQKGNESVASNPADTEVEVKLSGIDPSRQEMYSKSLIVIDGAVMGNLNRPALNKMINIADIQSINVWKGDAAIKRYGDKGKYGVVEIITKKNNKESVTRELSLKEVAENPTENKIFEKVEIEPAFPGGNTGWQKYLEKNLDLHVAETNQAQSGTYTVYVVFIVHKDGSISDIKPLTHHGFGMEEEAIRVISGGPKWIPAVQNGWKVNAYKKQPVTFIVNRAKDAKVVPE